MAWQLIYTSAPRLLEAGRSGFGTVARHRQISPLIVSALERASQFARLPGLDPGRITYSHRFVTAGGSRFHILSCIRDAGADYTGRTNHLAHHLIIEPREAAQLGSRGPSPADVLLAMPWRSSWTETPRQLDEADEIPLAGFRPQSGSEGAAWARLTGDPAHAWLLATGEASRGAYLLVPAAADLRPLFAESLRLSPDRSWQTSFTTAWQPSDEASDFRWIGLEANSPLAGQASGGRPVLDLTAPTGLPAVDVPAAVVAALPPPSADLAPPRQLPTANPASPAARPIPTLHLIKKGARVTGRSTASGASATPFDDQPPARRSWAHIGLWVSVLGIAAAVAILYPLYQAQQTEKQERQWIIARVRYTGIFDTPQTVRDLEAALPGVAREHLPAAHEFGEFAAGLAKSLSDADFEALQRAPVSPRLQSLAKAASLNVPKEIGAVADELDRAAALAADLEKFTPSGEDYPAFETLRQRCHDIAALGQGLPQEHDFEKIRTRLAALGFRKQTAGLLALLLSRTSPHQPDAWFREAFAALRPESASPETLASLQRIRDLLDDWRFVKGQSPQSIGKRLSSRRSEWPGWLAEEARGKSSGSTENTPPSTGSQPSSSPPKPVEVPATPIYFINGAEGLKSIALPQLEKAHAYFLRPSLQADPIQLIEPAGPGKLWRKNRLDGDPAFTLDASLTHLSAGRGSVDLVPPFILLARDSTGHDLLQVWVAPKSASPLFPRHNGGVTRDGNTLRLNPAELALPGIPANPLKLWLPDTCLLPGRKNEALPVRDWSIDLTPLRAEAEKLRDSLKQEIDLLQAALAPRKADLRADFAEHRARLIKTAKLDAELARKDSQTALDLADQKISLLRQAGGCIMAVTRTAKFDGAEALFANGKDLWNLPEKTALDPKAMPPALLVAQRVAQDADRHLATQEQITQYHQTLLSLSQLLALFVTDTPQDKARRAAAEAQWKAQLADGQAKLKTLANSPLPSSHVPPGNYLLSADAGGTEIFLVELDLH